MEKSDTSFITFLCSEKRIDMASLATQLKIDKKELYDWKSKGKALTPATIEKLSSYFGISPEELYLGRRFYSYEEQICQSSRLSKDFLSLVIRASLAFSAIFSLVLFLMYISVIIFSVGQGDSDLGPFIVLICTLLELFSVIYVLILAPKIRKIAPFQMKNRLIYLKTVRILFWVLFFSFILGSVLSFMWNVVLMFLPGNTSNATLAVLFGLQFLFFIRSIFNWIFGIKMRFLLRFTR